MFYKSEDKTETDGAKFVKSDAKKLRDLIREMSKMFQEEGHVFHKIQRQMNSIICMSCLKLLFLRNVAICSIFDDRI